LGERSSETNQRSGERSSETEQGLGQRSSETKQGWRERSSQTNQGWRERSSKTKPGLGERSSETEQGLGERSSKTEQGLGERSSETEQGLGERSSETKRGWGERSRETKQGLGGSSSKKDNSSSAGNLLRIVLLILICGLCAFLLLRSAVKARRTDGFTALVDSSSFVADKIDKILESEVKFVHQEHYLKPKGVRTVQQVSQILREHPEVCIKILGYTGHPPLGKYRTYSDAKMLGYLRARTIAQTLMQNGCTNRIACRGCGAVIGKGAKCEINVCTEDECNALEREAFTDGQYKDMEVPP